MTPLHFAISRKRYDILDLLIELGGDLESEDGSGQTALAVAMLRGDQEAMRRLHAAGAKPPTTIAPSTFTANMAKLADSVSKELEARWSLTIGAPFDSDEVSCAWVAPVTCADGSAAVLKVTLPHFEAEHEIAGLRFWDGDPTVRLIEGDERVGAMLLERCVSGTHPRVIRPELEQDVVIASLLRRLWRRPAGLHPFRPLSIMTGRWREETLAQSRQWTDAAIVQEGLNLLQQLSRPAADDVLLTDLHAGNILQAQRAPWLVIDPKPFIGDPAYDATQHLLNCIGRLRAEPVSTIQRFAELLGVDSRRVQMWTFARLAAEPRDEWSASELTELAPKVAP